MNQINLTVSLDADNKEHMLAATRFFAALANGEMVMDLESEEPEPEVKTEEKPVKKRAVCKVKEEPTTTAPLPKEETTEKTTEEITVNVPSIEEIRALARDKAVENPEVVKPKIREWLKENGIDKLPEVPEGLRQSCYDFLKGL